MTRSHPQASATVTAHNPTAVAVGPEPQTALPALKTSLMVTQPDSAAMTFREIAQELRATEQQVTNDYYRAMAKLRRMRVALAQLKELVDFRMSGGWL